MELSYGRGQRTPAVVACKNGSVLHGWQQAAASEKRGGFAREEPWYQNRGKCRVFPTADQYRLGGFENVYLVSGRLATMRIHPHIPFQRSVEPLGWEYV